MKKGIVLAAGFLMMLCVSPAMAQIHMGVGIRVGPPHPVREVVVERPFRNAVWIPGYHRWHANRHEYLWVPGRWVRAPRMGAAWIPERWERRNGEWVFYEGRWKGEHADNHEHHRRK